MTLDIPRQEPAQKPRTINPQVKQLAIRWLITLDTAESAAAIEAVWPLFTRWMNITPENRDTYLWVERTWHEAGVLVKSLPRGRVEEWMTLVRS